MSATRPPGTARRVHDEIASIVQSAPVPDDRPGSPSPSSCPHPAAAGGARCTGRAAARPAAGARAASTGRLAGTIRRAAAAVALTVAAAAPNLAQAELIAPGDQLRVTYGPWAYHFDHSAEHVRFNHLLGAELMTRRWTFWSADRAMVGFAAFDNSFGQFSQYGWFGLEWDWARFAGAEVFANVTAGLLYGYRDEYRDKIPFNAYGIAPVIIPSVGLRWGRFSLQATVLGANGFLFAASWLFDLRPGEPMATPVARPASDKR